MDVAKLRKRKAVAYIDDSDDNDSNNSPQEKPAAKTSRRISDEWECSPQKKPKLATKTSRIKIEKSDESQSSQKKVRPATTKTSRIKTEKSDDSVSKPPKKPRVTAKASRTKTVKSDDCESSSQVKPKPATKTSRAKAVSSQTKLTTTSRVDITKSDDINGFDEVEGNSCTSAANTQHEIDADFWNEAEMLSKLEKIPLKLAQNLISLLSEGCTLPFIARYRKTNVDNLMPDRLQELYDSYENITHLKKKVKSVIEALKKNKKLTPEVEKSILNARNLSEVDLIYAPLKSHSLSLAERARKLGLESHAIQALNGEYIDLKRLCTDNEEMATVDKVESHVVHIIADIIYKDTRVLEQMRTLKEETRFTIQSNRTASSTKQKVKENETDKKKQDTKSDPETYKIYFEWKCPSHFIKPHQTLALNRGEDEKILSVKVVVPDWFYNKLERFCLSLWKSGFWVRKGLGDAYNRLIKPWLSRHVRSDLTTSAQKEAVKTFTTNLEKYLLTEPIKNRTIAGLDPGFRAGCKVGIINCNGAQLDVCTIHPDLRSHRHNDVAANRLKELILKHSVDVIGLGNGTACRETEMWLKSHNICENKPIIIVPEQGASIYSISKEAQKEHPNMDPNLISALSIARRVLDPLGELIKVDPKNLGVGMYQHDIPPKMLETALDSAVEKVVSLVGVDINTASLAMLRRISGLNEGRAKKIIAYRHDNSGFSTRAEILKVPGIGKVTFQQCAGFLTVLGSAEPLDTTIIHPESYGIAKLFAKKVGVNLKEIIQPHFPQIVETKVSNIDISSTSEELKTDICTLELIINAFKQKKYEDNIITFSKPVYSLSIQNVEQIKEGTTLTGVVRNVVPFGCFVDCGVGDNGLIHRSNLGGNSTPKLGDRVAVTVIASPKPKKIQLRLEKILN